MLYTLSELSSVFPVVEKWNPGSEGANEKRVGGAALILQ